METRERIRTFIVEEFFVSYDFPDDASFLRTGIIGSMGLRHLATFLESDFGISLREEDVGEENLDSIERAADLVTRKSLSAA